MATDLVILGVLKLNVRHMTSKMKVRNKLKELPMQIQNVFLESVATIGNGVIQ